MSVQEILGGVWRITLPFGFGDIDHVHIYLIRLRGDGYMLFDSGSGFEDSNSALAKALKDIGVEWNELEVVVLSHHHVDHAGGSKWVSEKTDAKILIHAREVEVLKGYRSGSLMRERAELLAEALGVGGEIVERILGNLTGIERITFTAQLGGSEVFETYAGEARIVETPGHAPGQVALYLPSAKTLISADMVFQHFPTSVIYHPIPGYNPLHSLLQTIKRIRAMKPARLYPAHGPEITDPEKSLNDLENHHLNALKMVKNIVDEKGKVSLMEAARTLRWRGAKYMSLPPGGKLLALLETRAYLEYLAREGEVEETRPYCFSRRKG